ncbi:MAG: PD40 domain-containing protein, partial [Gemmatimonadales bacterium]
NILLHDGRPVVADFGIAVAISAAGGGRMTETGLSLGTPHYMSPEQASADRDLSARSDIYSLGCVLYEMIAGQPPHTGPSAQSVLVRILTESPRPLTEMRHTVPPHVAAVAAKAIEKLPADRFDTAKEFVQALGDETFTYRTLARPAAAQPAADPTPSGAVAATGAALPWRSDRRFLATAALAVVLGAAALAGLGRQETPLEPATRALLDLDGVPVDGFNQVHISPDGRWLATVARVDGLRGIWIRRAEEPEFRLLLDEGDPTQLAFSPGSDWLAYTSSQSLMKVALTGGAPRTLMPANPEIAAPIMTAWSDDGSIYLTAPDGVFRVPENGGEPTRLIDGVWNSPEALPDGRGLLIADIGAESIHYLAPGADSTREVIVGGLAPRYVETGHLLYLDPQGGLWAAPFDVDRGEVTGEVTPILDDVSLLLSRFGRVSVSRKGTAVLGVGELSNATELSPSELHVVTLDGEERTLPLSPRPLEGLRWSPDGEWVAFSGMEPIGGVPTNFPMIFVYNTVVQTTPRRITYEGGNWEPLWSPDGTRLVFASEREGAASRDLFVVSVVEDDPPEPILPGVPGRQWPSQWLDGDLLLFNSGQGPNRNGSWTMQVGDSASAEPYLEAETNRLNANVAPQGDLAAYESNESGVGNVYVRSFPEPRQQTIVSTGGGVEPRWSPDGNTIYFWKPSDPEPDTLFAARVQRDPFAVLSTDVVLAGHYRSTEWDLHPDGDRFIVPRVTRVNLGEREGGAASPRHYIVTNWFTELLAALGEGN